MDVVIVRKDGIVKKLSQIKYDSLKFFTSGHLAGFETDSGTFFQYNDEGNYSNYLQYIEYRNKLRNIEDVNVFLDWQNPNIGESIIVRKREIVFVENNTSSDDHYKWVDYTKQYVSGDFFSEDKILTTGFTQTGQEIDAEYFNTEISAYEYFKNNIKYAKDQETADAIGDTAQTIYNITQTVFKAFSEIDIVNQEIKDRVTEIKNYQKQLWIDPPLLISNIINIPDVDRKKIYINNRDILSKYFDLYVNFKNYVLNSDPNNSNHSDLEKLLYLAIPFSPAVLQLIPATLKIKILKFICSKKYVNNVRNIAELENEKNIVNTKSIFLNGVPFSGEVLGSFIVNLVYSVKSNEVDYFLDNMLSTVDDGLLFIDKIPLYQILYDNLGQSYNISVALLGFSNLLFKTDFKPTETKSAFVHALYGLWMNSKYNPYDINGDLKQDIFYIESLDGTSNKPVASDKYFIEDNVATVPSSVLYKYSYETAYQLDEIRIHPASEFPYWLAGNTEYVYSIHFPEAAPITIPYESEKRIGVFKDNFTFQFKDGKIEVLREKLPWYILDDELYEGSSHYSQKTLLYGTYHPYQPVTLINNNVETKIPIPTLYGNEAQIGDGSLAINSLIPIFVLKMVDDLGDRSDVETVIGYTVDGVLTFSGIGNATKLRHLRWAAMGASEVGLLTKTGLRVVLGGVEFTSGVLGFFANFVNCSTNDPFCKNMKNFIMLLQLATLSVTAADTFTTMALRRSAKKVIDSAGGEALLEQKLQNANVGGNNSYLAEASQKIKACAIIPISVEKIEEIINTVKKAINKANLDKSGNPFIPPKFSISHWTNSEMGEFIRHANDKGLTQKDIEIFLFVSGRKEVQGKDALGNTISIDKSFGKQEAINRIDNAIDVTKPRKYPFGYSNLSNFGISKTKLKQVLEEAGLPTDKVYIGGSSLQMPNPRDFDIYVGVGGKDKLIQLGEDVISEAERLQKNKIINGKARQKIQSSMSSIYDDNKMFIYGHNFYKKNGIGKSITENAKDLGVLSTSESGAFPEGIEIIIKAKVDDSALYMKVEF